MLNSALFIRPHDFSTVLIIFACISTCCAFSGCTNLTDAIIPGNVSSLGDAVFSGCTKLVNITIPAQKTAYTLFSSGTSKVAPSECYSVQRSLYYYIPSSLKCITFTGKENIADYSAYYLNVNQCIIDNEVTAIGKCAFSNCSKLTLVTIGNSVTTIGEYAFRLCSELPSITMGNSVTSIENAAFYNCSKLSSVTLTNSVTSIESSAFSGCSKLSSITLPNSVTSIESSAFYNCSALSSITMGNSVTSIGEYAFSGCSKLSSITFTDKLKKIDGYAFLNSGLTTVEIPESVLSIGANAFKNCKSLESCLIPTNSKISTLSDYLFSGCSNLQKFDIPTSVTKIGNYTFQDCTAMTEVKIASSVASIGTQAFGGCTNLNDIYAYSVEPVKISATTFSTYQTATLHCPSISYYNYFYDTQWSKFPHLINFDAAYDYVAIANDFYIDTDDQLTGTLDGKPRVDIAAGGAVSVQGNKLQELGDIHLSFDGTTNKGASLIAGDNLTAENLYIDITVKKDYWHFFCFPFDVDLTKIQKEGSYVFRYYDSEARALNGQGGWKNVNETVLHAGKGYIFRTNTAGLLSLPVVAPDLTGKDVSAVLEEHGTGENIAAADKDWNFAGNRYLSYYDINDLDYTAPIIIWNGTTYVAYRPGDDDYVLTPFQAFFVQKPSDVSAVGFDKDGRITYQQSQSSTSKAPAHRAASDRKFINLSLAGNDQTDETRIVLNERQSVEYEAGCDAAKFFSSENVPAIYTLDAELNRYAINERPVLTGEIPLGFIATTDGQYSISAKDLDITAFLLDNETGESYDLSEGYSFYAEAGTYESRFSLILPAANGIDGISQRPENIDAVYDLTGRRTNETDKGLLIINGKKVIKR